MRWICPQFRQLYSWVSAFNTSQLISYNMTSTWTPINFCPCLTRQCVSLPICARQASSLKSLLRFGTKKMRPKRLWNNLKSKAVSRLRNASANLMMWLLIYWRRKSVSYRNTRSHSITKRFWIKVTSRLVWWVCPVSVRRRLTWTMRFQMWWPSQRRSARDNTDSRLIKNKLKL